VVTCGFAKGGGGGLNLPEWEADHTHT